MNSRFDTPVIRESYVIHNALWANANPNIAGMRGVPCLEDWLGRELTSEDFTDATNRCCEREVSDRLKLQLTATSEGVSSGPAADGDRTRPSPQRRCHHAPLTASGYSSSDGDAYRN